MSRPKPSILLSRVDPKTFKAEQILKAAAIYAVFHDGQPINLRSIHTAADLGHKYKKTAFSNPGHAFNLCDKLNALFRTNKFAVHMLTEGPKIEEQQE